MEYKSWRDFIESQAEESYFRRLMNFVDQERQIKDIYPPRKDMFSCFAACQLSDVKVVIIGQDPYHGPGQAHGMSFSVREGVKIPPSLVNIFKELQRKGREKKVNYIKRESYYASDKKFMKEYIDSRKGLDMLDKKLEGITLELENK